MSKKVLCLLLAFSCSVVMAGNTIGHSPHHKTHVKKHTRKKHIHKKHKKNISYMYGKATYYGGSDGFEGRRMANGERFYSDNISVAAHPTLPLGTKLKVTDLYTQRTIYVEVTDRMPKRDKVIDLSNSGAKALGMHRRGVEMVQLEVISDKEYQNKKNTVEIEDGDTGVPG